MFADKAGMVMQTGSIFAPDGSNFHKQGLLGVRVVEGSEEVSWYQKYNPLATVPYATFKSLVGDGAEETAVRDVEPFHAALTEAIRTLHGEKVKEAVDIIESTIKIEASFAGKIINDYKQTYKATGEIAIPR